MPYSSKYDGFQILEFEQLGYDSLSKGLDPTPRLVSGSLDLYVDPDRTLTKRPGLRENDIGALPVPLEENSLTFSEAFDDATWLKTSCSVVANSIAAPDGTITAETIVEASDTAATHYLLQTTAGTADADQTYTVYAKPNGRTQLFFQGRGKDNISRGAYYDLTGEGSTSGVSAGATVSIRKIGSAGWYRCTISYNLGSGGIGPLLIIYLVSAGAATYNGDGSSGVYLWRAQHHLDLASAERICERLWLYETLENPAKVYILGSWKGSASGKYKMYYVRLGTSGEWESVGTTREIDNSDYPHECAISNGRVYIKGFPATATGEKLGTTSFDGTDATLNIWGTLGPTDGATINGASGTWDATAGTTTVKFGWLYSYSWITETGHISNRAPFDPPAGNRELSPSNTGAFTGRKPKVDIEGIADTTGLPTIQVWRSLDGGGVFPALEQFANPGASTTTYVDDSGDAAAGDPRTDFEVDTRNLAPSGTSNGPPPSATYPLVTGTADVERSTDVVEYAGRLWYAIGNVLYFSGREEILNGVPQESWPSGLRGNYERFRYPIRYLIPTNEALYIVTNTDVHWLRGTDRASFQTRPLFDQLGGVENQRQAWAVAREVACFITKEYEVAMIRGNQLRIISGPLGTDLSGAITSTTQVQVTSHFFEGAGWILVGLYDPTTPANSRIFSYDITRSKWNPPWVIPFSAFVSGRVRESDSVREVVVAIDEGNDHQGVLILDFDQVSDELPSADTEYAPTAIFNLLPTPGGNHLNLLRVPAAFSSLQKVKIERTKYSSDTDPAISVRLDDFDTDAYTALTLEPPDLLDQSTSYVGHWCAVDEACQRAQVKVVAASEAKNFSIQTMGLLWHPSAGS